MPLLAWRRVWGLCTAGLAARVLLGCGAVPDASSRSAPQYDPSGWAMAVPDRVDCDACALATSGCVSFPMDAGRIQHTRLFLLRPLPASTSFVCFCFVCFCFAWFCFVWLLLPAPSASALISSCFPLRRLTASSSSYFVCFCFDYFLLTCCLYTTSRLTPAPNRVHIQPAPHVGCGRSGSHLL